MISETVQGCGLSPPLQNTLWVSWRSIVGNDEPGAFEVTGGTLMFDAAMTAQGKPGSPLRLIIIGTLAPAESGWWHDLVNAAVPQFIHPGITRQSHEMGQLA